MSGAGWSQLIILRRQALEIQERILQRLLDANTAETGAVAENDIDQQWLAVLQARERLLFAQLHEEL